MSSCRVCPRLVVVAGWGVRAEMLSGLYGYWPGEVVAVFTHPSMSFDKRGKMGFLGDRSNLGEAFEVLAERVAGAVVDLNCAARLESAP